MKMTRAPSWCRPRLPLKIHCRIHPKTAKPSPPWSEKWNKALECGEDRRFGLIFSNLVSVLVPELCLGTHFAKFCFAVRAHEFSKRSFADPVPKQSWGTRMR